MEGMCKDGICPRCKGAKVFVLGLLVILNAVFAWLDWPLYIGLLITLWGLITMIKPTCGCCAGMMSGGMDKMPAMAKKKQ